MHLSFNQLSARYKNSRRLNYSVFREFSTSWTLRVNFENLCISQKTAAARTAFIHSAVHFQNYKIIFLNGTVVPQGDRILLEFEETFLLKVFCVSSKFWRKMAESIDVDRLDDNLKLLMEISGT